MLNPQGILSLSDVQFRFNQTPFNLTLLMVGCSQLFIIYPYAANFVVLSMSTSVHTSAYILIKHK